jgi:nicotinamidase-related amidase
VSKGHRLRLGVPVTDFALFPARTALINVDMQKCFVEDSPLASPDGLVIVERVNQLAEVCRAAGILVVHTRGWMRPDGSNLGVMAELVPPFIRDLYTEGADSAELHPSLVVNDGDVILNKARYGAFHGTDLELILRSRGVDAVIVTGIATNICCETTAREAAQRDYRVFFVSDATATTEMGGVSAEDLHRATCASLGRVFAQVVTVNEMIDKITQGAPAARSTAAAGVH